MSLGFKLNRKIEVVKSVQLFDVRFHPVDGNVLAVTTIEGDVFIYSVGDDDGHDIKPTTELLKHHKGTPVRKVRFADDGSLVTSAKTVKIYDLATSTNKFMLKRNDDKNARFYSILLFDSSLVCAGDDEGEFFMWDTRTEGDRPVMQAKKCDQYISDMDADRNKKIVMCTSGDGTLTAFDVRMKKMIEPQSELFEAGFQCLKYMELNEKVVVGGEDGSLYVFKNGEWGYTREKVPVTTLARSRGKSCSVDCIDILSGTSIIVGCSDGRLRALNLYPHKILKESIISHKISVEALHVNPNLNIIATCDENMINLIDYVEDADEDNDGDGASANNCDSDTEDSSDNDEENEKPEPKPKSARGSNSNPRSAFFNDLAR